MATDANATNLNPTRFIKEDDHDSISLISAELVGAL
jgi:hypothetical protein